MDNILLAALLAAFLLLLGLLSHWLNILFKENYAELAFPLKALPSGRLRAAKTAAAAFFCCLLLHYAPMGAALCRHFALASAGEIFFFAVYAAFLLIMLCSDLEQQIIPDKLLALFAILGLLHSLLFGEVWLPHVTAALLGGLIFLLLAIITRGGIGGGDIKLIAALGLWLGPSPLKAAALGGIIIGGIWALLAVLLTKKSRRDVIPYGPSFILAALFAYAAYLLPG